MRRAAVWAVAGLVWACGGAVPVVDSRLAADPPADARGGFDRPRALAPSDPLPTVAPPAPEVPSTDGCADLFHQDLLPTYQVEISAEEWAKLEDEFLNTRQRREAGLDPHPWHPIVFRYRDEVVHSAMIRLRGKSSWLQTIDKDPNPKMQFVISFNELHPKGRFHGLRKILLDMPRLDKTFLAQRLALSYLRDLGLPAQCANNARLEINGEYYGLFTNLEKLDKEFIQRVFGKEDDGDLWKAGYKLKTNEATSDGARRQALFGVGTVEQLEALADLDASVRLWAADALIPNGDGYSAGAPNFYLYDHPTRGFLWLPFDLDATFTFNSPDLDPVTWATPAGKPRHWEVVMAEPGWQRRYLELLTEALGGYDVEALDARIERWAAQIAQAAADDPRRPFTLERHRREVEALGVFLHQRADFMRGWLEAR
jgi:hypothetical protein